MKVVTKVLGDSFFQDRGPKTSINSDLGKHRPSHFYLVADLLCFALFEGQTCWIRIPDWQEVVYIDRDWHA